MTVFSVSSTCSASPAGIDRFDRTCCSVGAVSCADQRSAAWATSSRIESLICGTSRNITTMATPWPLSRTRSVSQ